MKIRLKRHFTSNSNSNKDISNLAYALWQQRGCPDGSPEQDWLEAERKVQADYRVLARRW